MWSIISLKDLMRETDYVVVASLSDVKEWTRSGTDYGLGKLHVTEVLSPRSPESSVLTWENGTGMMCARVQHLDSKGQSYIWLLHQNKDGTVSANHPGRVVPIEDKDEVLKFLKDLPAKKTKS